MKHFNFILLLAAFATGGCSSDNDPIDVPAKTHTESGIADERADDARGPHGGRLLADGDFRIELSIFESGVEPQFRAHAFEGERALPPGDVRLEVELTRLGGAVNRFSFAPRDDYLLGDGVVEEPHSFTVDVTATHAGRTHRWSYDAFEGRTRIDAAIAEQSGIVTEIAGPAQIHETLTLHGTVVPDPQRVFPLHARFPGIVKEVRKRIGESVQAGEPVAVIESNESLQRYSVIAPAAGVVVSRQVNPGRAVEAESILTIADLSTVWVELAAFQHDMARVQPGQPVTIRDVDGHQRETGRVDSIAPVGSAASQSMTVRVLLPNPGGQWRPGLFVTGEVIVAQSDVPVAVRRDALQTFRDWTVVFERVGEEYEVRPLDLGRGDGQRVEVLSGIEPGANYVSTGSYLVKADIDKSGASHDH